MSQYSNPTAASVPSESSSELVQSTPLEVPEVIPAALQDRLREIRQELKRSATSALQLAKTTAEEWPTSSVALSYMASACLKARKYDAAYEWIQRANRLRPEDPAQVHRAMGIFRGLHKMQEAKEQARLLLTLPTADQNAQREAKILLGLAEAVMPPSPETRALRKKMEAARSPEKHEMATELLRTNPKDPGALQTLCELEYSEGNFRRALAHAVTLLQIQPNNVSGHLAVSRSLIRLKRTNEAYAYLLKAQKLLPENAHVSEAFICAALASGKTAKAHAAAAELHARNASTPGTAVLLAYNSLFEGKYDEAEAHLRPLLRLKRHTPSEAHVGLIIASFRKGHYCEVRMHAATLECRKGCSFIAEVSLRLAGLISHYADSDERASSLRLQLKELASNCKTPLERRAVPLILNASGILPPGEITCAFTSSPELKQPNLEASHVTAMAQKLGYASSSSFWANAHRLVPLNALAARVLAASK